MKNNRPILILALVLAIAVGALVVLQKTGSIKRELRDFAVKDTANVTKVFLADKTGKKVTLERVAANRWTVDGRYNARKEGIDLILEAIAAVDVITPVAKAAHNNIIKDLASGGIKVEVYVKGDLAKTYYVGHETQDQMGTYMLLEHSSMPFVMGILGFNGFLTPRFSVYAQEWRDRRMFYFENPANIAKIEIKNNENPDQSFVIENSNQKFILKPVGAPYKNVSFIEQKVRSYIPNYMNVPLEAFINHDARLKDSVMSVIPFTVISVTAVNGQTQLLKLVYMSNNNEFKDDHERALAHNPEHLYGLWNDDKDLVLLQFTTIDRLLKGPDYFMARGKTAN